MAGVIMLATLPFFKELVPVPILLAEFVAVSLTLIAAYTSPESKIITIVNVVVSVLAVIVIEYFGIQALYTPLWDQTIALFFWTSHILALDFLIALYFATKTLRGMMKK